jgi:hypothetical protein
MKLLYSSSNALMVSHLRNLLESADIACRMKNEFLYSGAGEIPPTETWPELWVGETDFAKAKAIVDEALADKSDLPQWQCPKCEEWVDGQFALCWNCGEPHNES